MIAEDSDQLRAGDNREMTNTEPPHETACVPDTEARVDGDEGRPHDLAKEYTTRIAASGGDLVDDVTVGDDATLAAAP